MYENWEKREGRGNARKIVRFASGPCDSSLTEEYIYTYI